MGEEIGGLIISHSLLCVWMDGSRTMAEGCGQTVRNVVARCGPVCVAGSSAGTLAIVQCQTVPFPAQQFQSKPWNTMNDDFNGTNALSLPLLLPWLFPWLTRLLALLGPAGSFPLEQDLPATAIVRWAERV